MEIIFFKLLCHKTKYSNWIHIKPVDDGRLKSKTVQSNSNLNLLIQTFDIYIVFELVFLSY